MSALVVNILVGIQLCYSRNYYYDFNEDLLNFGEATTSYDYVWFYNNLWDTIDLLESFDHHKITKKCLHGMCLCKFKNEFKKYYCNEQKLQKTNKAVSNYYGEYFKYDNYYDILDAPEDERIDLTLGALDNAPAALPAFPAPNPLAPATLARHHIIPKNALKDFWNDCVAAGDRVFGKLYILLTTTVGVAYGITSPADPKLQKLNSMNPELAEQDRLYHDTGTPTTNHLQGVQKLYVWMPGNLFIGPSGAFRTDDPHDGFEVTADHVTGISVDKRSDLQAAYNWMVQFHALKPKRRTTDLAHRITSKIIGYVADGITPLTAADWIGPDGQGRYHL